MDMPDAYVTVCLTIPSYEMEESILPNEPPTSHFRDNMYFSIYDMLTEVFQTRCNINLLLTQEHGSDTQDIVVRLDGSTGDTRADEALKELLHDTALRALDAIIAQAENGEVVPEAFEESLYVKDQHGKPHCAEIVFHTAIDSQHTFFSVVPEGMNNAVAVLSAPDNQYVDANWHRKNGLTVYSIFDQHKHWYDASTGKVIPGSLASYLHIPFRGDMI